MTNAIGSSSGLSSDSLMNYCSSQLDSIDNAIDTTMETDQNATQISQQLQGVIETFQQNSTGITSDTASCAKLETSLAAVITQMQNTDPDNPNLGPMIQTYNNMVWSGSGTTGSNAMQYIDPTDYPAQQVGPQGDGTLSSGEMSGYISTLQGASSSLDSGSEMNLVELQSLMSQRETAISLTTNLVQSLGDQANTIASNIGK
jgi:hypothetical protein